VQACLMAFRTAVKVIWNWGMTMSQLDIEDCDVGVDLSTYSEKDKQGVAVRFSFSTRPS
jgi:hypothetical protein